jgi:hypothetical protein
MAQTFIALGAVPARESPAPVGEPGYAEGALRECQRFMTVLRTAIGPEPDGARLRIRRSATEAGFYLDVIVEFDEENTTARAYAIRCDREAPTRWP